MDETVLRFAPKPDQSTGTAPLDETHPIVMVLGMHRSGTSLCSHVLSALGVDMADRLPQTGDEPPADNPKGHWERWEIVDLHDRILALFNRGYFSPLHDFGFPSAWWADPRVKEVRQALVDFLRQHRRNEYFGFKDPRAVRMGPLWRQITAELSLQPKIVYCLRNPAQVARSLRARDKLTLGQGEYRWFLYNMEFFLNLNEQAFCTIEFETWFEDPSVNLGKLRKFLSLPDFLPDTDIEAAVSGIVDNQLRHDDRSLDSVHQPLIRTTYDLARRADRDPAARDQLRETAAQFATFQRLQSGLQDELEAAVAAAARLPAMEQAAAALHDAEHQRDVHAAGLQTARAELDAVRQALGAAEERAATAEALRQEIAALQAGLPEIQAQRDTHAAGLQAAQAELDAVRQALADAEIRAAAGAALREEIATLQADLPEIRRQRDAQAAGLATAQAELNAVRQALADAEGRAAAAEALRQEIAALQAQLLEIQGQRDAQAAGLQVAQAELSAAHAGLGAVRQALAEAEGRAAATESLRQEIAVLQAELPQLQHERDAHATGLQAAEAALRAARTDAQATQTEPQSVRGDLQSAQAELDASRRALIDAEVRAAAAEALRPQIAELRDAVNAAHEEVAARAANLAQAEARAASLTAALTQARQDAAMRETAEAEVRDEIARLERAIASHEAQLREKTGTMATLGASLAAAEERAAAAEGEVREHVSQIAALQNAARETERAARAREADLRALEQRATTAERDLGAARDAETTARAEIGRQERRAATAEQAAAEKEAAIAVLRHDVAQARAAAATAEGNAGAARDALCRTLATLAVPFAVETAGLPLLLPAPRWGRRLLRWFAAPFW